jgi:uracil-DNA glycosylase
MLPTRSRLQPHMTEPTEFEVLRRRILACTLCRDAPRYGTPLPHIPRPVFQGSSSSRIGIISQAPGARVHKSGIPYTDPSGVRLRQWLGLDDRGFYDAETVAVVPMGFCFPGNDANGGDLPPRRECGETWHELILQQMPNIELFLLIGGYAQKRHLDRSFTSNGVTDTVRRWREIYDLKNGARTLPLPHPSWRNTGWIKRNPWFAGELLPVVQSAVGKILLPADITVAGSPMRGCV